MTELIEAFKREAGRFEEFRNGLEELKGVVRSCQHAEGEIGELIEKSFGVSPASLFLFVRGLMLKVLPGDEDFASKASEILEFWEEHIRSAGHVKTRLLRGIKEGHKLVDRLLENAKRLDIPNPPSSSLSKALDLEVELPLGEGLRLVRLRELSLHPEEGQLRLRYEAGGGQAEIPIREISDLPLLLPVLEQAKELMGEAIGIYWEHLARLEEYKRRLISNHPREILMRDL
jgi:hypothetical protein